MKPFTGKVKGWPNWTTPEHFLERVRKVNRIALDPCSNRASKVRAVAAFVPGADDHGGVYGRDGLLENWQAWVDSCSVYASDGGLVFVNPPYHPMNVWAKKIMEHSYDGGEVLCLVGAKTDTSWFHDLIPTVDACCFWRGRISFDNPPPENKGPAPSIASWVGYWGPNKGRFVYAFRDAGYIID